MPGNIDNQPNPPPAGRPELTIDQVRIEWDGVDSGQKDLDLRRWGIAKALYDLHQSGVGPQAMAIKLGRSVSTINLYIRVWREYGEDRSNRQRPFMEVYYSIHPPSVYQPGERVRRVGGALQKASDEEVRQVISNLTPSARERISSEIQKSGEPKPTPESKPEGNVVSITKARAKKVPLPEPEVDPDDAAAVAEALPKKAKTKKAKKQSALDRVIYKRVPRKKENKREAHVRWIDEGLMDVIRPIAQVQLDLEANVDKINYITPEEAAKIDNLIGQIQNATKAIKKYRKSITIKE